jgi:hypothetical protein
MKKFYLLNVITIQLLLLGFNFPVLSQTWQNVGSAGFTSGTAAFTSLAFSNSGEPYLAFEDGANSGKASVVRFDGSNWVFVGSPGFATGTALEISLVFNGSGGPYISFADGSTGNAGTVMKYDGTDWVLVGNAGFTGGIAGYSSLAFSSTDEPYFSFSDGSNSYKASLMKFNGTNWVHVGVPGFSAGVVSETVLAFSGANEPYVAFSDWVNSNQITVMKYDGSNWTVVGSSGFSGNVTGTYSLDLKFGLNDEPYVAFSDGTDGNKATVMRFDGSNWINVGATGFTSGGVEHISLAFSPGGEPYLAMRLVGIMDITASVSKFDGNNWVNVGPEMISSTDARFNSIAFSSTGEPYIAFMDLSNADKATVMKFVQNTSVNDDDLLSSIVVLPNPAKDRVSISGLPLNTNLTIYTISGQVMFSTFVSGNSFEFNCSDYSKGLYIIKIESDNLSSTKKFIVE